MIESKHISLKKYFHENIQLIDFFKKEKSVLVVYKNLGTTTQIKVIKL